MDVTKDKAAAILRVLSFHCTQHFQHMAPKEKNPLGLNIGSSEAKAIGPALPIYRLRNLLFRARVV